MGCMCKKNVEKHAIGITIIIMICYVWFIFEYKLLYLLFPTKVYLILIY